jgi:hypothetical protein
MYFIDANRLTVTSKVAVSFIRPLQLAAPTDAPYAYYVGESQSIGRVNLETRKDEGVIPEAGVSNLHEFSDIAVSANGSMLYNLRLQASPTRRQVFRIDEGEDGPKIVHLANLAENAQAFHPDAMGQYVACDDSLFDTELRNPIPLDSSPICFLSDKPFFFGYASGQLKAYSSNTLKLLSTVDLPLWPERAIGGARRPAPPQNVATAKVGDRNRPYELSAMFDPANANVLVAWANHVAVIPLKEFNLPDDPLLTATIEGPRQADIGQTVTLKIVKKDSRAAVSLASGGADFTLDGDTLVWKPTDAGTVSADLTLSGNGIQRTQTVRLTAHRTFIDAGFIPHDWQISPDGKSAVAIISSDIEGNRAKAPAEKSTKVVLMDLEKGTITASRILSVGANVVAIDDRNVYVALQDSDAFYVLSNKDLSDVKRIFTRGRIAMMGVAGGKYLFMNTSDRDIGDLGRVRYLLPDLTPVTEPSPQIWSGGSNGYLPDYVPIGDNWYSRGILYDASLDKARMIVDPTDFVKLPAGNIGFVRNQKSYPPITPWGAWQQGVLLMRDAATVGQFTALASQVLSDIPAALTLELTYPKPITQSEAIPNPASSYEMVVRDLFTGKPIRRLTLSDDAANFRINNNDVDGGRWDQGEAARMICRPGMVVVQIMSRFFVVSTKDIVAEKLAAPLNFPLTQSTLILDPQKPTAVTFAASGGKPTVEYALSGEAPWLQIDKTNGNVTISPEAAQQKIMELLIQRFNERRSLDANQQQNSDTVIAAWQQFLAGRYKEATGETARGIPVAVMVGVTARDSEQMSASTVQGFFLDVPIKPLADRIRKMEEDAQSRQSAQPPLFPGRRMPATQSVQSTDVIELRQKITDLQKRNTELQAQVDLLKELIGQKGAATRP